MIADLRDLYQEVILDHGKRPRNLRCIRPATHHAEGYNPLCGDRFEIFLTLEDGVIRDISFCGTGCAISTASASMMTEALKGLKLAAAEEIFASFHCQVAGEEEAAARAAAGLGKLAVFSGVREYPTRVKCASLPWHTYKAALQKQEAKVSTES